MPAATTAIMSILRGAAEVLSRIKDDLSGTVVFICQPSEEKSPVGGAKGLIASGALDGIDAVYGLHVWPTLPSGTVGVLPGPMMAASDHIRIVMKGKTSHAAMPHKGVDAIVAAAQFLTAAQTIISRRVNPLYPAVLTFGKITGGTRYNVVADTVEIEGTCRTYHEEAQDAVETYLQDTLKGMDAMYGTESTLYYERGYAAVRNTPAQADFIAGVVRQCLGDEGLADVQEPAMTAEDFSGYLQHFDGGFFWLGATPQGQTVYPLHNTHFAVDEKMSSYRRRNHGIISTCKNGIKYNVKVSYDYWSQEISFFGIILFFFRKNYFFTFQGKGDGYSVTKK